MEKNTTDESNDKRKAACWAAIVDKTFKQNLNS